MRYIWNCILKVEMEVDNKQGKYKSARFKLIASTQKNIDRPSRGNDVISVIFG
jgi:hypothetical protein